MITNWTSRLAEGWARMIDAALDTRAVDLAGRIGDPRSTRADFDVIRGYFPDHS